MFVVDVSMNSFKPLWEQLVYNDLKAAPFYSDLYKLYQQEYYEDTEFKDISFLTCDRKLALIGICGSISKSQDGFCELSNYGKPLMTFSSRELSNLPDGAQKSVVSKVENIINEYNVNVVHYRDLLINGICSKLTHYLMQKGATASPVFTCIIDLSLPEEELKSNLRKSFKKLLSKKDINLTLKFLHGNNVEWLDYEKCRQLHIQVAGRVTRNIQSWELQYNMIRNKEAFAIAGELDGKLVSFGLFLYSVHYCYAGVAASRRDLFDKPLFHKLLWEAILFAKKLGCRYFETGEVYHASSKNVSKKEIDIANFKRGFGSETKIQLDVYWDNKDLITN